MKNLAVATKLIILIITMGIIGFGINLFGISKIAAAEIDQLSKSEVKGITSSSSSQYQQNATIDKGNTC